MRGPTSLEDITVFRTIRAARTAVSSATRNAWLLLPALTANAMGRQFVTMNKAKSVTATRKCRERQARRGWGIAPVGLTEIGSSEARFSVSEPVPMEPESG